MSPQNPVRQSKFRVKAPLESAADRVVAPESRFASHQIASGALLGVALVAALVLFGISLWWWTLQSGIHSTIAGVLAAFAVPTRPYLSTGAFLKRMPQLLKHYKAAEALPGTVMEDEQKKNLLMQTEQLASNSITPLQRWEGALYKPVMLFVVPVFAFLNAGIAMPASIDQLTGSVIALAIATALFLGKTLGVCAFAWLGVRAGLASLPDSVNFRHVFGLASLAGIGFTMSLFVSVLAFGDTPALMREAKLGILLGSLLAAISGTTLLLWANSRQRTESAFL